MRFLATVYYNLSVFNLKRASVQTIFVFCLHFPNTRKEVKYIYFNQCAIFFPNYAVVIKVSNNWRNTILILKVKISFGVSSIAQSSPPPLLKVSCNFFTKGGHNEAVVVKQLVVSQAWVLRFETKSMRPSAIRLGINSSISIWKTVRNSFFPLDILSGRHTDYIDFVHHISIMFKMAPSPNSPRYTLNVFFPREPSLCPFRSNFVSFSCDSSCCEACVYAFTPHHWTFRMAVISLLCMYWIPPPLSSSAPTSFFTLFSSVA